MFFLLLEPSQGSFPCSLPCNLQQLRGWRRGSFPCSSFRALLYHPQWLTQQLRLLSSSSLWPNQQLLLLLLLSSRSSSSLWPTRLLPHSHLDSRSRWQRGLHNRLLHHTRLLHSLRGRILI